MEQQQEQQAPQNTYSVTLTVKVAADTPVNAALVFGQVIGQPGADKFIVTDEKSGQTNHVDFGLLQSLGFFQQAEPQAEAELEPAPEVDETKTDAE